MSGRRSDSSSGGGSFWGTLGKGLLIGAGVVAAGAAAAVAAYSAAQEVQSRAQQQQEACSQAAGKSLDTDSDDEEDRGDTRHRRVSVGRPVGNVPNGASPSAGQVNSKLTTPGISLKEKLECYYEDYVKIPRGEMEAGMAVANKARKIVLEYFRNHNTAVELESIHGVGSAFDGLKVIAADEFDFAMCFRLKTCPDICLKELKGHSCSPGYWLISDASCDVGSENVVQAQGPAKKGPFIDLPGYGKILSPESIRAFFQKHLHHAFVEHEGFFLRQNDPAWVIEFRSLDGNYSVHIDFIPTFQVGSRSLVAKPHPAYRKQKDERYRYLWYQSFEALETAKINSLPATSCHRACLQIIKSIRLNFPAEFARFSSYIYKTILMNMVDSDFAEEEWEWDSLAERYFDFLLILSKCLHNGDLPHALVPDLNLLEGYSLPQLRDLANFVDRKVRTNKADELLMKQDVHRTAGQKLMDEAAD